MRIYHTTTCIILGAIGFVNSICAQEPVITNGPASAIVSVGGTVTFEVGVAGTPPFTYKWLFNGSGSAPGIVTTVAGSGPGGIGGGGFSGDGGPATSAELNHPSCVYLDNQRNLLIADTDSRRIRLVRPDGVISTIAGRGFSSGDIGDGGPATNAWIEIGGGSGAIAFSPVKDKAGNIYIADAAHNRVRRVGLDGIITTFAGNGTNSFSGDGGYATNATFSRPVTLAVDAESSVYIADSFNDRIRKVDTNGIITTVAGNGTSGFSGDGVLATNAGLSSPIGMAFDDSGNMFIADAGNLRVRRVDVNGFITTVAGNGLSGSTGDGGAATNARIYSPGGVAVDSYGNVFVSHHASSGDDRVRQINANGIISTVAGNGTSGFSGDGGAATNAGFNRPAGLWVDDYRNLYIVDHFNHRVRKVRLPGEPTMKLKNVSALNAGDYSVVVSNSFGSVTSSIAKLSVIGSAITVRSLPLSSSVVLSWDASPGSLQSAANSAGPYFDVLGATSPCTNVMTNAVQFFRLKFN